jgi:polyferredoxin
LLWRHSRSAFQIVLFLVAGIMLLDGLLGSQLAARNTATVGAWVHYRGLIVVALLLAGNLFCAGCPFILPRRLAHWLGRPTRRWPKPLRNKWLALAALISILFIYEWQDLWASPWLTAWVIVAYFLAAFVLGLFFTRDSFCLYLCPLGTFNFLYSTTSPLQITNRSAQTCRDCVGKECINGRYSQEGELAQQGCQLELYVPTIQSNMNCTLCLDCAKACPHDNVALAIRPPGDELFRQTWPRRLDLALLAVVAAFAGLVNAFAMTPPFYALATRIAAWLNTTQEVVVLALVFCVGMLILPLGLVLGAAWLNRLPGLSGDPRSNLRQTILRYAYAFVPVGFAVWAAHYLFHLLIGPLTIIPAFQNFWIQVVGIPLLGAPEWRLGAAWIPPFAYIQTLQMAILILGLILGSAVIWRSARRTTPRPQTAVLRALPWWIILLALTLTAAYVFLQPMEMRGSLLG